MSREPSASSPPPDGRADGPNDPVGASGRKPLVLPRRGESAIPGTDRPVTDRSATDRSATDRSATDRSATDRSATDRPVTDRPGPDRSGAEGYPPGRHAPERPDRSAPAGWPAGARPGTDDRPARRPPAGGPPAGPPGGPPAGAAGWPGSAGPPTGAPLDRPDTLPPAAAGAVQLGLWGSATSGKTTFLAAMQIATWRGSTEPGDWTMLGTNEEANEFLEASVKLLTEDRRFPEATAGKGQWVRWQITGTPDPGRGRRWRPVLGRHRDAAGGTVQFRLEVLDLPGKRFLLSKEEDSGLAEACLEHMAGVNGLIYLFDPTLDLDRSPDQPPSMAYFHKLLGRLKTRLYHLGGLDRGRLPHHVAVCVTKFDDPAIFQWANESGLVTMDAAAPHLPRVTDPARFFGWLCDHMRDSNADLLRDALVNSFHPDRVRYYVVSSIGFRLNEDGVFDPDDPANVRRVDDEPMIVGDVRPMNILEPIIQLERKIRTGSWSG